MPEVLGRAQIDGFVEHGFVRLEAVVPDGVLAQARTILWKAAGCDPDDPASWTRPVVRLGPFGQPPFRIAAGMPALHAAFDQLVGKGRWLPLEALGSVVIRFPSPDDPGDAGWHVDMSFGTESPNFLDWRINLASRGRALLMLFLFTDVGEDDAPTRLRAGSHRDIARQIAPAGDAGMTLGALAADGFAGTAHLPERLATGPAGTVYLCHPFLVHAAQRHRGRRPRILAQPPLLPREPISPERRDGDHSPVEVAIRQAIGAAG